jgi:ribosomal protein S18 acetylase RimI-like enzyme
MIIRPATESDLDEIIRLSKLMPNISVGGNENLLRDIIRKLMSRDSVIVVAEEKEKLVGMIGFAKDASFENLVDLRMIIKASLLRYGSPLKLVSRFFSSRRMMELIRGSYHGFIVAVEPEFRRKDVATELWKEAEKRMKGKVTLLIDSENKSSRAYAENKIGVKNVSEIQGLFESGKKWILYVKNL